MYSDGPPHMAGQKQDNQLEHTSSSYVRIRDVALKTSQRRWTIGKSGERGSGISVLVARHVDGDNYCYSCVRIMSFHGSLSDSTFRSYWGFFFYFTSCKIFTPAYAGVLSKESERQRVSLGLQGISQQSCRSQLTVTWINRILLISNYFNLF